MVGSCRMNFFRERTHRNVAVLASAKDFCQ
jgi:hypothetical protein